MAPSISEVQVNGHAASIQTNGDAAVTLAAETTSESTTSQQPLAFDTLAIHTGSEAEATGAVIPSITLATAFKQSKVGISGGSGFDYSRFSNPNRNALEANIAALEGGKHAVAFASGTAVTSALLSLIPKDGHLAAESVLYGGTYKLFTQIFDESHDDKTSFLDTSAPEGLEDRLAAAIKPNTRILWLESPMNPTLGVIDIVKVCKIAKTINPSVWIVVDSTFASPWYQNPLALGADVSYSSITKYINGMTDVLGGIAVTASDEIGQKLKYVQSTSGAVPSPFDCWLVLRSLKTLPTRMREHGRVSLRIARYLEKHPLIKDVIYPGLPSHPGFQVVKSQIAPRALQSQIDEGINPDEGFGFSGMLSFRMDCDPRDPEPGAKLLKELKLITLALSLGGVESLIEQPSTMTHWMVPEEERIRLGIGHDLIRLSVGLEDAADLERDLDQALQAAFGDDTAVAASGSVSVVEPEAKKRKLVA